LARSRAEYNDEPFDVEAFRATFQARDNDAHVLAGRWSVDEGYGEKGSGPDDAASVALFLASDDAANMTGQDINTGGAIMW
jgi:NAD(P)-dependent dehydrogenase (short-subunit alcohol dehydrogenase family)